MLKRFLASLTLAVGGLVLVTASPASADPPPPAYPCQYVADHYILPGMTLLYADYDGINSVYVSDACWTYKSSGGPGGGAVTCTYHARWYVSTGVISGPYGQDCHTP